MAIMTPETTPSAPPPQDDPYRYGWRYVRRELPEGGVVFEEVPLTLEDVLYPQEGDQVTHSKAHQRTCKYLVNVLEAHLTHDLTATILDDVRIAWDVPDLRPNGPDIAVIRGVREQRNWSTFDVAEEGVRPELIIEVTSPETRGFDLTEKLDIYALAGVAQYVIVDIRRWKGEEKLHLLGYRLGSTGYNGLSPDDRGWLPLETVGLRIGIQDNQVVCYDAEGNPIGDYVSVEAARAQAEDRAQAEAQARLQAEARLLELEAELRRLRGEV